MNARIPLLAAALALAAPAPAGAIVNGAPDGDDHPYVAVVGAGDVFCTASLVAPSVLVTAGHCTAIFADIGGPVYATFDEHARPDSAYVYGTPHTMDGFRDAPPNGTGLPASVTHDVGVVVLDEAADPARMAELPPLGLLDGAVTGLPLDVVGYGADGWHSGGGRPFPTFSFDRIAGTASVIGVPPAGDGEFVAVSAARGKSGAGPGPGDSGGPALLAGSDIVTAVGSHGASLKATGQTYSARLDTPDALAFVTSFTD
jgi:hypothetical protein